MVPEPARAQEKTKLPRPTSYRLFAIGGAAILAFALAVGGWMIYAQKAHALTDKDTIVLADFANTTGDPVFDGTLRQGLSVQLAQSPFLSIVSDEQIQQTLVLMGQPLDAKLTPEIARQICERAGSKAYLTGSIASVGTEYVLGMKAVNCITGDTLAEDQERATGKEQVLAAMDKATPKIREKLGEPLNSVKRFDIPLEQASTSSLEALQAFSLGSHTLIVKGDSPAAVPFFLRAISIDPKFASAYAYLGDTYANLGEASLSAENLTKAHALRDRASEAERFNIDASYYAWGCGKVEKARRAFEIWEQTYPRDSGAPNTFSSLLLVVGQYERALDQAREAVRLDPAGGIHYGNVVIADIYLNRFDDAKAIAQDAQQKNLGSFYLGPLFYQIAFVNSDSEEMAKQIAWAAGKPGIEDLFLEYQADTSAYSGAIAKSRDLSRQAEASAKLADEKETAAGYAADAALREALVGNAVEAKKVASDAIHLSSGREAEFGAALALAIAGDVTGAKQLAGDLEKRYPEDTLVQFNYLPSLRAQLAINGGNSSEAIVALQSASPYELGISGLGGFSPALYPIFLRGMAYLSAHQGTNAAAEFQKILDHRGIAQNEPIGALARLQIGRAYAMQGDTAKAKAAYQDFLALWKNADPDIPILKDGRAEYATLK